MLITNWPSYNTLPRHPGQEGPSNPSIIAENLTSVGHLNARSVTIGRQIAQWKGQHHHSLQQTYNSNEQQSFRLARIGHGWIIGSIEASNGMKKPGIHVVVSACRLHHLPKSVIKHLQQDESPRLAMNLYQVLSFLATKRQEMTIEHLGQHLRILNSPVPRLHGRRRAGLAILHQSNGPQSGGI